MKAERTNRGGQQRGGKSRRALRAFLPALVAAATVLASTLVAPDAWSKAPPAKGSPADAGVATKGAAPVAGVTVQAAGLGRSVSAPLRRGAEAEARRLAWKDVPGRERVVLSTSLVRLDTTRRPGGASTNAVVAVGVFGVEGGDVKAVIEGSAEVKGEGERSRQAAVEAAARGAVRSVPAAMRQGRAKAPPATGPAAPPQGARRAPAAPPPARPAPAGRSAPGLLQATNDVAPPDTTPKG